MSKGLKTKKLVVTAIFVVLVAIGGFIRIPIGAVPITLQMVMVLLAGNVGGKQVGALATTIYVMLGLIGIPLFSAGGGIAYVFYPTFGYIFAFIIAGLIAGIPKKGWKKRLLFNLIAVAVVHLVGVTYFYLSSNLYLQVADKLYAGVASIPIYTGAKMSLWQAFLTGSLVFLPIDILSAFISATVGAKLSVILNQNKE